MKEISNLVTCKFLVNHNNGMPIEKDTVNLNFNNSVPKPNTIQELKDKILNHARTKRYPALQEAQYAIDCKEGHSDNLHIKLTENCSTQLSFEINVIDHAVKNAVEEVDGGNKEGISCKRITRGLLSVSKLTCFAAMAIESDALMLMPVRWQNVLRASRLLTYCGIAGGLGSLVGLSMMYKDIPIDGKSFGIDRFIAWLAIGAVSLPLSAIQHIPEEVRTQESKLLLKIAGLAAAVELTGIIGASLLANGLHTQAIKDMFNDTKSGYYQGISG